MAQSDFTNDDVEQILRVVDSLSNVEVRFETGDIKLHVRKYSGAATANAPSGEKPAEPIPAAESPRRPQVEATVVAAPRATGASDVPAGLMAIRAPMLGCFYRAASPTEPPYVEVGDHVSAADPICIIEVMKLFNTLKAGVAGTIVSIAVENAAMVEFDQLLFVVKPD